MKFPKALLFVPVLALTSCGAPKISEAKAQEIRDDILAKQAADDFEYPETFTITREMSENFWAKDTNTGKVEEEKMSVKMTAKYNKAKNYAYISYDYYELDEGEVDEYKSETYIYIKDNTFYVAEVENDEKHYTKQEIPADQMELAQAGIYSFVGSQAKAFDYTPAEVLFYDSFDDLDLDIKGYTYYSTGKGNLEERPNVKFVMNEEQAEAGVKISMDITAYVKVDKYCLTDAYLKIKATGKGEYEGFKGEQKMELKEVSHNTFTAKVSYPNLKQFTENTIVE